MGTYAKFMVALIGAIVIFVQLASHESVTRREWITVGIAVLAAIGVLEVPNKPSQDSGNKSEES